MAHLQLLIDTPTTETTIVQSNLFNKYLLLVTFETMPITIRFDSKWKNTVRTALVVPALC